MNQSHSQIEKLVEQVKLAMLAHIPVVYIPTDQVELIQELLYGEQTIDALVPRVSYDSDKGTVVKLSPTELGKVDENGKFASITDNIVVNPTKEIIRTPSIKVSFVSNWNGILSTVGDFIKTYLGVKKSASHHSPDQVDLVHRSLYIVVTPREEIIPPEIAPYVKTVRIASLTDEEIETIIRSHLSRESMPDDVVDEKLMNQMVIRLRGFSVYRIEQIMNQLVAQQSIDYQCVDSVSILETIRESKKQLLENSIGLKWEYGTVTDVAGLDAITRWLFARKGIFSDPEGAIRQHIDIPKGILVSGIPGSGKSLMAKVAASILDMPLISMDMGALLGGLMGESEHNLINALQMAEQMAPCVLWIDEIEKAFSGSSNNSSSSDGGVGRRMFGKFLTWMQEKSAACFVFATSNDITSLPPELFRSERFDRKFFTFMPTAMECAEIFAAIIKSQNSAYRKNLKEMPYRIQVMQAKQLFSPSMEEPEFWLDILNNNIGECSLVTAGAKTKKEDSHQEEASQRYLWQSSSRPRNKLLTGADISALIKEAKFRIHPSPNLSSRSAVIYEDENMKKAVESILQGSEFKPYGETNLKDIVKCFIKLHENEFVSASGDCILDFEQYDEDECLYHYDPGRSKYWSNYDKVLHNTIVGAINYYATKLRT